MYPEAPVSIPDEEIPIADVCEGSSLADRVTSKMLVKIQLIK